MWSLRILVHPPLCDCQIRKPICRTAHNEFILIKSHYKTIGALYSLNLQFANYQNQNIFRTEQFVYFYTWVFYWELGILLLSNFNTVLV